MKGNKLLYEINYYKVIAYADYKDEKKSHFIYSVEKILFTEAYTEVDLYNFRDDAYPLEFHHYYLNVFEYAFYYDQHVIAAEMAPACKFKEIENYTCPFSVRIILTAYSEENAKKLAKKFINDWFLTKGK